MTALQSPWVPCVLLATCMVGWVESESLDFFFMTQGCFALLPMPWSIQSDQMVNILTEFRFDLNKIKIFNFGFGSKLDRYCYCSFSWAGLDRRYRSAPFPDDL